MASPDRNSRFSCVSLSGLNAGFLGLCKTKQTNKKKAPASWNPLLAGAYVILWLFPLHPSDSWTARILWVWPSRIAQCSSTLHQVGRIGHVWEPQLFVFLFQWTSIDNRHRSFILMRVFSCFILEQKGFLNTEKCQNAAVYSTVCMPSV